MVTYLEKKLKALEKHVPRNPDEIIINTLIDLDDRMKAVEKELKKLSKK